MLSSSSKVKIKHVLISKLLADAFEIMDLGMLTIYHNKGMLTKSKLHSTGRSSKSNGSREHEHLILCPSSCCKITKL
jgi:hypothetical protein